jgi:hypothetical protein
MLEASCFLQDTPESPRKPRKQHAKGLRSLKGTEARDNQRLLDALQRLLATIIFIAVLLVLERVAEREPHTEQRQDSWRQMLWCREHFSSDGMNNASAVGALFPSGK